MPKRPPHPQTIAIRGGLTRSDFDETAEALLLTSSYVYASAAQAEAAFAGEVDHYLYTRYGNPTVSMFEERLRLMEGAEACFATATGMAAVFNALACRLVSGDRVVASRALFGSCHTILSEILPLWGIHTEFVDPTDPAQWERALSQAAQAVFVETPSNPMQDLVDLKAVAQLAHAAGAFLVVDNVFATPVLQRPLDHGADVVVYSATKHIDGQGRVMGGAILGSRRFIDQDLQLFMYHTGPSLSPFNAWVLLKGLETLELRVERQSESAHGIATWLEGQAKVRQVRYPTLKSHPQAQIAGSQMRAGGTVVTFEIDGGKNEAFQVIDGLEIFDISNNLGDTKSLVTHPATTTHRGLLPKVRQEMGITDGVIRLSVGLEHPDDLIDDLHRALSR